MKCTCKVSTWNKLIHERSIPTYQTGQMQRRLIVDMHIYLNCPHNIWLSVSVKSERNCTMVVSAYASISIATTKNSLFTSVHLWMPPYFALVYMWIKLKWKFCLVNIIWHSSCKNSDVQLVHWHNPVWIILTLLLGTDIIPTTCFFANCYNGITYLKCHFEPKQSFQSIHLTCHHGFKCWFLPNT